MDSGKITISQFADTCGIPRPTMSQLMNGRNKRISDEVINKIHNGYPSLSIMWLMFGEGEMESNPNIKISEPQNGRFQQEITVQPSANQGNLQPQIQSETDKNFPADNSMMENSLFDTPDSDRKPQPYPDFSSDNHLPEDFGQDFGRESSKGNISFEVPSQNMTGQPAGYPLASTFPQEQAKTGNNGTGSIPQNFHGSPNDITRTLGQHEHPAAGTSFEEGTNGSISISPDAHKKITNIVVFYSDNSFQSFLPDA